jgi:hypothetical protein
VIIDDRMFGLIALAVACVMLVVTVMLGGIE